MKEDKHYICIGSHSFKPESTLQKLPTSVSEHCQASYIISGANTAADD